MRIKVEQKQAAPPYRYHPPAFSSHPKYLSANTVYLLRPPRSLSSDRPWIIFPTTNADGTVVLRHPLSSKPLLFGLPRNFDFSKLHPAAIAVSYQYSESDKLVAVPAPPCNSGNNVDARHCLLLALYGGGKLQGCPPVTAAEAPWVKLSPSVKLDDIAVFRGYIYAVNRQGSVIDYNRATRIVNIGKTLNFQPVIHDSGGFGWRKRLVVDENDLYLVVRLKEKLFQVFMLKWRVNEWYWDAVREFKGKKVLFMAKDHYFFRRASRKFPGREYKNCIVFHEVAFPQYEDDYWVFRKFTESQRKDQFGVINKYDEEIAVFRLDDRSFAREGENSAFPKIYWSPPAWIFRASSAPVPADEFQCRSASVSSSQLEREPDEAKGLDSVNRDENDGEVQSDLKVSNSNGKEKQKEMESDLKLSNSKDKEKQKELESEFGNQDQGQEGVESDSDSQDQEDGKNKEDMRIKVGQKQAAPPSNTFTCNTYYHPAFSSHPQYLYANTVYLLRPPRSLSSDRPWIIFPTTTADGTVVLRHPLTSKPLLFGLPRNFDFPKLHPSAIAVSYQYSASDKLVAVPAPPCNSGNSVDARQCLLLALYGGGELQGCPPVPAQPPPASQWVKLSPSEKLDDIAVFRGYIYAVNRQGRVKLIDYNRAAKIVNIGKTLIFQSVIHDSGGFAWRKRLVVDENDLYLVVRLKEKLFQVFMLKWRVKEWYWDAVREFKGKKVLFMAKDHYFFRRASRKFPGREYKNCIVFDEAAFPQYGNDCWVFRQVTNSRRTDQFGFINHYDDEIAVFRLDDRSFAREGENSAFPKIYWSPPGWIFRASSSPVPADEFQCRSASVSSSQLEREPDEAKGLDSVNRDENDGEVQSDLKVSNSNDEEKQKEMESDLKLSNIKDKERQKEMESEFGNQDQGQEGVESDSDTQDQEDGKMQCDADTRGKYDGGMHSKTNTEGDASLEEDTVTPSLSAVEEAATINLVTMNNGNGAIEPETSRKNVTHSIPKAPTSSTAEIHKTDSATGKFEGFDIRSDLVPTLQKIWRKHGNIIKYSILHSSDLVAKALESLATIVRILEDNSAQSLSDSQADYLNSTLSDLKCIGFTVYWLVSFVEKALKVHTNKALVKSFENLSQSSSQVKERKTILLDELAKLNDEENKLREEMAKVSKIFYGQVNFDEPIGAGLT